MFKKLIRNKKAQQTAEYALMISLVVAAVIAMQTYAQRSIQAKVKGVADYMTSDAPGGLGAADQQYEPYYLQSDYNIARTERGSETHLINRSEMGDNSTRLRDKGGFQSQTYNAEEF